MYNLLFWVAVHFTLLWVLERITRDYRDKKAFKIIFAPCVILECLHRVLACCLCAAPVTKMEFFEDGKPFIIGGKSRVPYLGPAVFLLAVVGFNIGVEIAQLLFILVVVAALYRFVPKRHGLLPDVATAVIFGIGIYWFYVRGFAPAI